MRKPGFTKRGFYQDKLMLGPGIFTGSGGSPDLIINTPTDIYNVLGAGLVGYTDLYSGPQDIICRSLIVNNQLLPVAGFYGEGAPDQLATFKVIVRDTLTLNSGGGIRCDGTLCSGGEGWVSSSGCLGFLSPFAHATPNTPGGTLGGSGSGGAATSVGKGIDGTPLTTYGPETSLYWGGSGGDGKISGVSGPGRGGVCSPSLNRNNFFQPSVYLDAMIYENNMVSPATALAPYKICGGAGGGGASDNPTSGIGGGAAGGGVAFISCSKLIMNGGSIDVSGGYGTTGGGGGAGISVLVAGEVEWPSSSSYILCAGGTSSGGGNGNPGTVLIFSNDLVAEFTGTVTKAIYDAAVQVFNSEY
jgi:hypothetical protein